MEKNELRGDCGMTDIKSQDDLHKPETHSTEVLLEAISKLETTTKELAKVKKQLEIAKHYMKKIEQYVPKVKSTKDFNAYEAAWFASKIIVGIALEKIEDLEKLVNCIDFKVADNG